MNLDLPLRSTKLLSGISVLSVLSKTLEPRISVFLPSGSSNDPKSFPGLLHLTEHLLFRRPASEQLFELCDTNASSFKAHTTKEHMFLSATTLQKHFSWTLSTMLNLFFNPIFNNKALSQEIPIIKAEQAHNAFDSYNSTLNKLESLLLSPPLSTPIIGDPSTFHHLTPQQLHSFHQSTISNNAPVVVAVGDHSHEHLVETVSHFTKGLKCKREASTVKSLVKPIGECCSDSGSALGVTSPSLKSKEVKIARAINNLFNQDPRFKSKCQAFFHSFHGSEGIMGAFTDQTTKLSPVYQEFLKSLKGKQIKDQIEKDCSIIVEDSDCLSQALGRKVCFQSNEFDSSAISSKEVKSFVKARLALIKKNNKHYCGFHLNIEDT
ncbi:hypothetical protein GEMRC1_007355 [Eukaryota sp. GEM-RC1]